MQYTQFIIENYRAIQNLTIDIKKQSLMALIGINECGKTTILQAIYCFDYSNDTYNGSQHLENVQNLYQIDNNQPTNISATLTINKNEITESYLLYENGLRQQKANVDTANSTAEEQNSAQDSTTPNRINSENDTRQQHIAQQKEAIEQQWGDAARNVQITRTITSNAQQKTDCVYSKIVIDGEELHTWLGKSNVGTVDTDAFVRALLQFGPHILYSDDFNDRPPNTVDIPPDETTIFKNEWQSIYNTLFKKALGEKGSIYHVANEKDERIQKSKLAKVKHVLNMDLKDAWQTFIPQSEKEQKDTFNIGMEIETKKILKITVEELSPDNKQAPKTFNITDRSKGFIWYFNLIMKIQYNPKSYRERSNSNTIFLLDEPGSYLHASAQAELCKKIKELSNTIGTFIYCTHSSYLLNPNSIPINTVRIVSKGNDGITSNPPEPPQRGEIPAAQRPLFEALHLPYFHALDANRASILVEGIYDAYAVRLFVLPHIGERLNVIPASGAYSIVQALSYFIGFQFRYVALWDNDDEGNKKRKQATDMFGKLEAEKFLLLPRPGKTIMRMESMFAKNGIAQMGQALHIDSPKYEKILLTLFERSTDEQSAIIKECLSEQAMENFKQLAETIKERLKSNRKHT